jgi:hypothetical protein
MMGRIDWLRGAYTVFSQVVLANALEIWAIFDGKRRMARMDWAYGAIVADGKDMEEKICEKAGWLGLTWETAVV